MQAKWIKHRAAWSVATLLAGAWLVACSGGGDQGDIDGLGPTPGEPNLPGSPGGGDNPYDIDGVPSTGVTVTTTSTSSSGGSGVCYACSDFISGVPFGGQAFCTGSETALQDLFTCGCTQCDVDCSTTCDTFDPPNGTCNSCLSSVCSFEYSNCVAN